MPEVIDEFDAKSESGVVYRLIISQSRMNTTSLQSRGRESLGGLPRIQTLDGRNVNKIDERTYKIVATGEIVTRL